MKVGDLIRFNGDAFHWLGYGGALDLRASGKQAKIRWFDDWDLEEIEWEQTGALEVLSESR